MLDLKVLISLLEEHNVPFPEDDERALYVMNYVEEHPYLDQINFDDGFLGEKDVSILSKYINNALDNKDIKLELYKGLSKIPRTGAFNFF